MKLEITDLEPVDIVLEDILKTNPLYSLKVQYDNRDGWCLSLVDHAIPTYISITSGKTLTAAAQKMRSELMKTLQEDKELSLRIRSRDKALRLSCEEMCSMLLAIRANWRLCSQWIMPRLQEHGTWAYFSWILVCDNVILNNEEGRTYLESLLGECTLANALPKRFRKREDVLGIRGMARIWLLGNDGDKPHLLFMTKNKDDKFFRAAIDACATWIELHEDKTNTSKDKARMR